MRGVGEGPRATRRQVLGATAGVLTMRALPERGAARQDGTNSVLGSSIIDSDDRGTGSVQAPTVYVGGDSLYAVDAVTGAKQWTFTQASVGETSPIVVDGTVYVGGDSLYAVDAVTGAKQWTFTQASGQRVSSPTVVGGIVYVGARGSLYAVDADSGEQKWVFTDPFGRIESPPTVVNGTAYVGSIDTTLYAVDATTGEQQWVFAQSAGRIVSSPAVVDGTVYVAGDSDLYAVDAATGAEQWAFTRGSGLSSPTVVDGTVYIRGDSDLYAVDAAAGTERWAFNHYTRITSYTNVSSPTVVNGTVYVGGGSLYAVDAMTGEQVWEFTQAGGPSSPTVLEGTVYVGSRGSTLCAVNADSGDEEWTFTQFRNYVNLKSSPTVVKDPESGNSVGSRVMLRTLGHHGGHADRVTGPSPAHFAVTIEELSQTQAGEPLTVRINIKNTGEIASTQAVELSGSDLGSNSTTVSIIGGNSTIETLSLSTSTDDTGEYNITARTENQEVTETANISEPQDIRSPASTENADSFNEDDFGSIETVTVGGGGSLALILGIYVLMRRSNSEDTQTDHSYVGSTEPTDSPDDSESSASEEPPNNSFVGNANNASPGDAPGRSNAEVGSTRSEGNQNSNPRTIADFSQEGSALGPPETISSPSSRSLSYADIEKGERVGTGGNADVYEAWLPDGDRIALKEPRMNRTVDISEIGQVIEKAEIWDKLDDHNHIVGVVDYDADPVPWIGLEYMDAGDMSAVLATEPSFEARLWMAVSICQAVWHAHRRGVAHLDLKPANVLFQSADDAWPVPKVSDWGLAKMLLDHSQSVEGFSPAYSAPEQFATEEYGPVDDITDIYQVGAVCYELFTGEPPFSGSHAEMMRSVLNDQPTPPSSVAKVPSELNEILLKALQKQRNDRYESITQLRTKIKGLSGRL